MDLCQAIFFRLKSIISSRSPPHKTSNDVNRNPREARRKNMFYVWYVNLDCVHIHTPFSSARSAEKFLYCTINIICSISIYIIYTYNYTHLIRAKRGENMKLYYVYHTTSYCVHISLHLFSSAQSAEIKCYVLRTTYNILIHVVYHKNIICVAYTGKHNLPIRAERGEKFMVYHHSRSKNHSRSINSFPPARRISV